MVTFAQLGDAQPELFVATGASWRRWAEEAEERSRQARRRVIEPVTSRETWSGDAADAAATTLAEVSRTMSAYPRELRAVAGVLRNAGDDIAAAQYELRKAVDMATREGLEVSANGTVTVPATKYGPGQEAQARAVQQRKTVAAQDVQELINKAVGKATDADERATAELRRHARASKRLAPAVGGLAIPPKGADPRTVNAWWKGLSQEEGERLVREHPVRVGSLDGVPAWARDDANRLVLGRQERRLRELLESGGDADAAAIEEKLRGIEAIEQRIEGRSDMFVLGFDTEGNGHAIVSVGNPDTADNVVSYVPGMGSKLSGIGGMIDRASVLDAEAERIGEGEDTASIVWLGYDAPQSWDVAFSDDAEAAAAPLDRFMDGIRATHEPAQPLHTTVLGHSYGSLATGQAAVHSDGALANDVILVGSPGTGVDHASELGLDPDHVWVGEAQYDPVADLSRFGQDPSHEDFGAQNFRVQGGDLWPPFAAHSTYWDRGSPSLENIGQIVVGEYGDVRSPPEDTDWWPW